MRAIWKGSISFGLANIPVRLFSASQSQALDLDMLHAKELSPIRYARICKDEEKEVPFEEIVKGFKLKTGEYVVVTEEDFRKADVKKTSTIAVMEFADKDEISPMYYEKPYFLAPEKGAEKVYALFRAALEKSGKVGIGKFVLRNREHLCALLPQTDVIVLNQLRFESELRNEQDLEIPMEEVAEDQLEVALALIGQLSRRFNPVEFKDTYIDSIKTLIQKKAEGKEIRIPKFTPKSTVSTNEIMKALKESLEKENQKVR